MKKQAIKTPNLVIIAVLTVITIAFWITFDVFRTLTIKEKPAVPPEILAPLNPTLDSSSLQGLQERIQMTDAEIETIRSKIPGPISILEAPGATPSATPISSPAGEINE